MPSSRSPNDKSNSLKSGNGTGSESQREALGVLARRPGLTRAELARELGLTRQAVTQLVDGLGDLVEEVLRPSGMGGQPAKAYRLTGRLGDRSRAIAIGLDIGHAHARVAAFDVAGNPVAEPSFTFDHGLRRRDPDYQPPSLFDWAQEAIERTLAKVDCDPERDVIGIGIGVAGPVDQDDRMLRAGPRPAAWEALDFGKELRERLPRFTRWNYEVDNDATLGAIAEHRTGAGTECENFVYVRWTYGIGSGLILSGEPYRGARGIAGEFGHIVFEQDRDDDIAFEPEPCDWCGQVCVQSRAGTETIVRDALARGADLRSENQRPEIAHVIGAAGRGDESARLALHRAARYVGKTLAIVIDLLNPELLVLGGAFGRDTYALVVPPIQAAMRDQAIQPAFRDVRIVMGHHGGTGGGAVVRGAAALMFERHIGSWALGS